MNANGTAVEGVNVTRRKHRAESWYFSREIVTVQGGYGTCFCRHGRNLDELDECRGTSLVSGHEVVPVQEFKRWTLVQCRGTNVIGAANLSRCRILIAGRCACPG